ncbi:MAG: Glu/Leu/Phe/Val dehydrogenase dimerization domain-containing protein [Myxococcota bacterium]
MSIFQRVHSMGHEQVVFCHHAPSGLRAIIAVHSTALGPSLGGCRILPYTDEQAALTDVLRLSRGMSYKSAIAGLDLGGGKSVIIADPKNKSEAMLRAFGRHIEALSGRYIVAEDMNSTPMDMVNIAKETEHVAGLPPEYGGIGAPGPVTAHGVYMGLRASLKHAFGSDEPRGRRIAVQGLGSVGYNLCRELAESGAELLVSDINEMRVQKACEEFGATAVSGDIVEVSADVLAPCAIGGVLSASDIPRMGARVVAGGANNILVDDVADAEAFQHAGILIAPDYVLNAGGIIAMDVERRGGGFDQAMTLAENIYDTTGRILAEADAQGWTPLASARYLAEERMRDISQLRDMHL